MRAFLVFLSVLFLIISSPAIAAVNEQDLRWQVEKLKLQNENMSADIQKLERKMELPEKKQHGEGESETSVGGYGELVYNRFSKDNSRSVADLRRFVISVEHRFDEHLALHSEVEWEHAVTSATDAGESAIEQAYLSYAFSSAFNIKVGLFLMPFGFLNLNHEPPVFYGVDRNDVETRIIPTTWREGGIGFFGEQNLGFNWDFGVTTGFSISKFDNNGYPLRAIHQEMQFAKAYSPAFYAALNYTKIPGFIFGGSAFTGNSSQGNSTYNADPTQPNLSGFNARVTLWDLQTRFQRYGFDIEALYTRGYIGDSVAIDNTLQSFNAANNVNRSLIPSEFYGWFLQAAYTIYQRRDLTVSPFVRFERFDTEAVVPSTFVKNKAYADNVVTLGFSFKPIIQVVLKADYQRFVNNFGNDRFNLGVGYLF